MRSRCSDSVRRLSGKLTAIAASCTCMAALGNAPGALRPTQGAAGKDQRPVLASLAVAADGPAASTAEVIILGCLHGLHKTHPRYSTADLTRIVRALHPQVLLIEYQVDWFESGKPQPGVLKLLERNTGSETEVAWAYCKETGASCLPYDVKGRNDSYEATHFLDRGEALLRAVLKEIDATQPLAADAIDRHFKLKELCRDGPADVVNSELCDEIVRTEHEFRERATGLVLGTGSAIPDKAFWAIETQEWADRNQAMTDNICAATRENPGKRILVTVGSEHRYVLRTLLAERCPTATLREYWQVENASAPRARANAQTADPHN
jgi:hypothetical protein